MFIEDNDLHNHTVLMLGVADVTCQGSFYIDIDNGLEKVIEVLSKRDPFIVHRDDKEIDVGDANIEVKLEVEVIDAPFKMEELPNEVRLNLDGWELDTVTWEVDEVSLGYRTINNTINLIPHSARVIQTDYLDPDGKDFEDDEPYKYMRSILLVFYPKK